MSVEVANLNTEKEANKYFIGVILAISSSVFIGSSFILKKISLLKLSKSSSLRAGAGGFGYLKDWTWWAGFLSMSIGEFLNLIAYGFAPASLVTSLGALSVLVSAVLASKFLQEHLTTLGKIGCVLCVFGSVIIIFNAPKEVDPDSVVLIEHLQRGPVIAYSIFVICTSFFLMCCIGPKYGSRYIVVYILLCSQVGSFTVMACKILVLSIRGELEGNHGGYQVIIISFSVVIVCACIQITYLNKALDFFGSAVVTPIYYVMFTTLVLLSSAILFDEWKRMIFSDIVGTLLGLFIASVAIFSIHAKKKNSDSFMMVESG